MGNRVEGAMSNPSTAKGPLARALAEYRSSWRSLRLQWFGGGEGTETDCWRDMRQGKDSYKDPDLVQLGVSGPEEWPRPILFFYPVLRISGLA